jgi:DnaK suppressor protein
MTQQDLEDIKHKLLRERQIALELLRRTTEQNLSETDDSTQDTGDLASLEHDKDILYQLQESYLKQLRHIDDVLARIDRDSYGTCEQCGVQIGKARLEAIPWATTCLRCQEQLDLLELMSPGSSFEEMYHNRHRAA